MFDSCANAKETQEELIKIVKSVKLSEVQTKLAEKFYNAEHIVEFLYNSVVAGGNGILYGPGGFGKSEITEAFLKFFGISPVVVVGNSSTDVESLLGIPNMKKLTEESIHEVAFEKSVFGKTGVLILEEFLDVKPAVASALKDIISAGGYRRGDEFIPSKIGAIFICSNKSPDEVSMDFSTAAFYKERFPYSKYVIWDDYSSKSYLNLFKLVHRERAEEDMDALKLISEVCASSCTSDTVISPRIAFSALDLFFVNKDVASLNMVASLNTSKISEIQSRLRIESQLRILGNKFDDLIHKVSSINFTDPTSAIAFLRFAKLTKEELQRSKLEGDDLLEKISILISILDVKVEEARYTLFEHGQGLTLKGIHDTYEDIQKYLPR